MKRNKIIQNTLILNRITFWLLVVVLTGVTFGVGYLFTFPESYPNLRILNDGNPSTFNLCTECDFTPKSILLSEIVLGMKFWILLRLSIMGLLTILIIHFTIEILRSVRDLKTFHNQNTLHFRRIATSALVLFLINTFNFIDEGQYGIGLEIDFPLHWVIIALFSLSLGEVFKEGQQLQEDKDAVI